MRVRPNGKSLVDIGRLDAKTVQAYAVRLERQKGLLEIVFNTIQEGILVVDRTFHIKYHNAAAAELLCLPEDIANVRLTQYLPDLIPLAKEGVNTVTHSEAEILYPVARRVRFYIVPHDHGQGDATVILSDITQEKRATDAHIETETLRMVSLLAAGVAHEIGNPLNSISLHLQLMKRDIERDRFSRDEFLEMLDTTANEVKRLDGIISRYLSALRPGKPQFVQVQLPLLIAECLKVMLPEIEAKGLTPAVEIAPLLPSVNGDPEQLKQLIVNLLKNAVQATPSGGTIAFHCEADDDGVILEIRDSGCGIAPEDIGRIFAPFQTTKKTGTGLGLMVVERVVRDHGAAIRVESEPGCGTAFIIKFPLADRIRMKQLPPSE